MGRRGPVNRPRGLRLLRYLGIGANDSLMVGPPGSASVLSAMERAWKGVVPNQAFEYSFVNESFAAQYRSEERLGQLFAGFSVLAILVGCLGLFGLAAYTTEQRTKEIGVRKVLGASAPEIALLLSTDFARLVFIAFVVAGLLGYLLMSRWLQDFPYQDGVPLSAIVVSGVLAVLVAWAAVSYQSVRAAMLDPARLLRTE